MADATTAPPTMMSAPAAPSEYVAPRRLFAFLIMVFGMFMSILDIQIVSASLADIQAWIVGEFERGCHGSRLRI